MQGERNYYGMENQYSKLKMKTIPSIRVDEQTIADMEMAIKKHNSKNLLKLTKQDFRRTAYELLSQLILQDELEKVTTFVTTNL